jgi:hypothetical protein
MAHFLGRLQTFLFGAAIGRAASDAVTPVLEPVKQQAWKDNQNKVLDPGTAAEAVAQGRSASRRRSTTRTGAASPTTASACSGGSRSTSPVSPRRARCAGARRRTEAAD